MDGWMGEWMNEWYYKGEEETGSEFLNFCFIFALEIFVVLILGRRQRGVD